MQSNSIAESLSGPLAPILLDLRDSSRAHIAMAIADDEVLRREAMAELRRQLSQRYRIFDLDYAGTDQLNLPRYCRSLSADLPVCIFAYGLDKLKWQSQEKYDVALDLLNAHREDIKNSGAAVILWLTTETEDDLRRWAPDFADWSTANVTLTLSEGITELQHQYRRYGKMLARPNLSNAFVASFHQQKDKLEERITQLSRSYDVYLSYSIENADWAEELAARLRKEQVSVWINEWEWWPSLHFRSWVTDGAPKCRKIVPIWSAGYFEDEHALPLIEGFLREYPERVIKERLVVPVLMDEWRLPASLREIRCIDFRNPDDAELRFRQFMQALDLPRPGRGKVPAAAEGADPLPADGSRFVEDVAELYRVLGFEARREHPIGDLLVDLLIRKKEGGFLTEAIVECWDHSPAAAEYDRFRSRLQQIRKQAPRLQWIVVSSQILAAGMLSALEQEGIGYVLYSDLQQELVPLGDYANRLIEEYEKWRNEHWHGEDRFIRPDVMTEQAGEKRPALASIAEWLGDERNNLLVILGDAGMGKSALVHFLAYEMAKSFRDDPLRHPAPVVIPLGDVRQEILLEGIISSHFNQTGLSLTDFSRFAHLAREGRVVLLFDAFDEMADRVSRDVMQTNLRELLRPAWQGWKALLTCRTNYFRDYQEQAGLLDQRLVSSEAEAGLYREIGGRFGQQLVYLKEFSDKQVRDYLARSRGETAAADWEKIETIYSLKELAQQPLLLEMIVDSLPTLERGQQINAANLYTVYTNLWVEREAQKGRLLDSQFRLRLMMELAWWMWSERHEKIRYSQMSPFIKSLAANFTLDTEEQTDVVREMQTASFLKRDRGEGRDEFSFAHPSFLEYFLARKLRDVLVRPDNQSEIKQLLNTRPYDPTIIFFLTLMDEPDHMKQPLRHLLTESYSPKVSENALQILYWSTRVRYGMEETIGDPARLRAAMAERIPAAIKLRKAELAGMTLEAAVLIGADFHGADLVNVRFDQAQADNADFRQADLHGASFAGAILKQCDFTKAKNLSKGQFEDADIEGVKGLSIPS